MQLPTKGDLNEMPATLSRVWDSTRSVFARFWARISIPAEERRRLVSVDALRAIAIGGMLLVNNHAAGDANPLALVHVDWEGLRFAEVVFPWFLLLSGVGMALSMGAHPERPALKVYTKFASRVVALLAIGLVLNLYKYGEPVRYMGVLQRIALAGAIAVPFARKKPVYALLGAALMLLVHTKLLLDAAPAGVMPGSFGAEDSFAFWVDTRFLGEHLYNGGFEPEGLLGVISSAGQVMLGIVVGRLLVDHPRSTRGAVYVAVSGVTMLIAGLAIEPYIPIIKNLWTASYVLVTSGMAALLLAVMYYVADVLRGERLLLPLTPPGHNALAIFVGSSAMLIWMKGYQFTPAVGVPTDAHAYLSTLALNAFGPTTGSIVYACIHLAFWYTIAAALDKARVYIRL